MSLNKIGKFSSATKAILSTNGKHGFSELVFALQNAGNINNASKWLSRYGKNMNSKLAYNALSKAFPNEYITDEIKAQIGYSAGKNGKVGDVVAGAGLMASLKNTGTGLITFLKPFLPVIAGAAVAGIGYTVFKAIDNQVGITKSGTSKKYQKTKEKNETEIGRAHV